MSWEYLKKRWEERKERLENARHYLRLIKEVCVREVDPECRVVLFGSVPRGNYRADSDVDVLIITDRVKTAWDRASVEAIIEKELGLGDPFEFHVVTKEEFEKWYKRFIDVYEEF